MKLVPNQPRSYSFDERLAFSRGAALATDQDTIKAFLGCLDVRKSTREEERQAIDYVATLRRGKEVAIQAKRRDLGCSNYWLNGPELALEKWSVKEHRIVGWTLDESKSAELILFTFDPIDWQEAFIISAQHLRVAFRNNFHAWWNRYPHFEQRTPGLNGGWHSEAVFVPVSVVFSAIAEISKVNA